MKYRERILTGTASGILMAAVPMGAHAMQMGSAATAQVGETAPVVLAQAASEDQEQKQKQRKERRQQSGAEEGKAGANRTQRQAEPEDRDSGQKAQQRGEQEAPRAASPEGKAERKGAPERRQGGERQAAPERAAAPEKRAPKAAGEAEPKRVAPKSAGQAEKPAARSEPKAEKEPAAGPKQGEPDAAGQRDAGNDNASPRDRRERRDAGKRQQGEKDRGVERAREKEAGKAVNPEKPAASEKTPDKTAPKAAGEKERQIRPAEKPDNAGRDRQQADQDRDRDRQRRGGEAADNERPRAGEREGDRSGETRRGEARQDRGGDQNAAPMLDSQKDAERGRGGEARRDRGDRDRNAERDRGNGERNGERTRNRDDRGGERAARRPDSDRAAQRDINVSVKDLQRLDEEKGRRIDRNAFRDFRRPEGAEVVKKMGDRTLIQFNNQIIVEDRNHDRIRRHARDVYYEELPDQLRREIVVRPDGSRIITVRNGYGDIVSRTRIVNGQRYVLLYAGDERHDGRWHDPAADLPPLQIDIPRSEYILESDGVRDPDRYYEFLDQPPVVPVEQLYTIDQVKYSARVRDMVRRVDLDTINFATGSAEISQSELPALEAIADAMQRMIDENPAETFLIEGHTDAVGSDDSNLVLSDERAEAVATALTDVYDIPPENLFTQGYGEQYLKVDSDGPERENRRVAIRRITPLVSPVASAEQ